MACFFNNDVIRIPDHPGHKPSSPMTIGVWFNLTGFANAQTLVCKPRSGPPWSAPFLSYLIRVNSSTRIEWDAIASSFSGFSALLPITLSANVWYHTAMVYDGNAGATGSLNGKFVAQGKPGPSSGSIAYTAGTPLLIGADYGAAPLTDWASGSIADVRIYNRALGPDEILLLGTDRVKGATITNGLVAWYPLDDLPVGNTYLNSFTCIDRTNNNNPGSGSGSIGGTSVGENFLSYYT